MTWREAWRIGWQKAQRWAYGDDRGVVLGTGAEIAVIAVAAVASAASAYMASESQAQAQRNQAKALEFEAEQADIAAEAAKAQKRKEVQRQLATFGSRAGAMGVAFGEGSELTAELAANRDADYDVRLAAFPYQQKAGMDRYKSRLLKWEANKTQKSGYVSAGLSLLSSAAGSYASYSTGKSTRPARLADDR